MAHGLHKGEGAGRAGPIIVMKKNVPAEPLPQALDPVDLLKSIEQALPRNVAKVKGAHAASSEAEEPVSLAGVGGAKSPKSFAVTTPPVSVWIRRRTAGLGVRSPRAYFPMANAETPTFAPNAA